MKKLLFSICFALLAFTYANADSPSMWISWSSAASTDSRPFTGTWYVGDYVSSGEFWYNYKINYLENWNNSNIYIGKETTNMSFFPASKYSDDGINSSLHANIASYQFTSSGNYYVVGEAEGSDGLTVYENGDWQNSQTTLSFTSNNAYFTVNELLAPTTPSATAASSSSISLTWTATGHNVMVVAYKTSDGAPNTPTGGTAYAQGASLGTGTVIYNGNEDSYTYTDLEANTNYTFLFYSENNSYYSSAVTTSATTNDSGVGENVNQIDASNITWTTNDKTLNVNLNGSAEIKLFSATGKLIDTKTDVSNYEKSLESGLYILQVNGVNHKIIIQ